MSVPWRSVEKAARMIRAISLDDLDAAINFTRESTCKSPYTGIRTSGEAWLRVLEAIKVYKYPFSTDV